MGISIRNYLFDEDGNIKRISLTLSRSIKKGEKTIPEYAGKTYRLAEVALELYNRKPVTILRIICFKWHFDQNGSAKNSADESVRLIFETLNSYEIQAMTSKSDNSVINIEKKLKKKTYDDRYTWKLTPAEVNQIINEVWKSKQKQKPRIKKSGKVIYLPVRR